MFSLETCYGVHKRPGEEDAGESGAKSHRGKREKRDD
jgi:hypothetical protein